MVEEKTKEMLMKMAIQKFLKESGFDDKAWVISLTCGNCHKLCKAFRPLETEFMLFRCEECGQVWQLIENPLGYSTNEKIPCQYLDEDNQCSNDDIPISDCYERLGKECDEKSYKMGAQSIKQREKPIMRKKEVPK